VGDDVRDRPRDAREQPRDEEAPREVAEPPREVTEPPREIREQPREVAREQPRVQLERPRCPFCHAGVEPDVPKAACDACMAWHHKACWGEGGGCGACGARVSAVAAVSRPAARGATARADFEDSAQSAVHAHRSSTARARRRERRPLWKTLLFTAVAAALVLGGGALVTANPLVGMVITSLVFLGLFLRSYKMFRDRRRSARRSTGASRARGGRGAG
jgi:hypothetical protein